jgi:hypothetical protein
MNYLKIYVQLIRKAQKQSCPQVYENHHVFPKSIYGNNSHVVKLTPRQHYLSHALLYKAFQKRYGNENHKTRKMLYAFNAMHSKNQEYKYVNSRLYEGLRKVFSNSMKGINNPFYGKTHSKETKERMTGPRPSVSGINHYLFGKTISEETRKKQSEAKIGERNPMFGKSITEEHRCKLSAAKVGKNHHYFGIDSENHPMFGKSHTEQSKKKMSNSSLGKLHSEETKQKISEQFKGRKWWTNGINDRLLKECPEGYWAGRSLARKGR